MPAEIPERLGWPAHGPAQSLAGPWRSRRCCGAPGRADPTGASSSPEQGAENAPALVLHEPHFALLADKARDGVEIGAPRRAFLVEDDRGPGIGGLEHRFRFGDHTKQRDRKDL